MRSAGVRAVKTVCPLDCFDTCGLVATMSDGQVVRIEGDPDYPITRGFICSKGRILVERAQGPERVVHPLICGDDGRWKQASWDRALDVVALCSKRAGRNGGARRCYTTTMQDRWGC